MKIIYFDLCALPLFLMILLICFSRKMTKGKANQLFVLVVTVSLFSTVADLGMEIADNMVPLSRTGYIVCTVSTYLYLALRNANNAILLLFLLALTRTTSLIRKRWVQWLFFLPYLCVLVLLAQNPFTHSVRDDTTVAGGTELHHDGAGYSEEERETAGYGEDTDSLIREVEADINDSRSQSRTVIRTENQSVADNEQSVTREAERQLEEQRRALEQERAEAARRKMSHSHGWER